MTAQIADTITIDGADHMLFSEPLEAYYAKAPPRPAFAPTNTGNWRGYIAAWEIKGGRLYLSRLKAELCDEPKGSRWNCEKRRPVGLEDLFKTRGGNVLAEWFSGTLRVPLGAQMIYQHMGYDSVYEFDLLLVIERGVVTSTTTVDNRHRRRG